MFVDSPIYKRPNDFFTANPEYTNGRDVKCELKKFFVGCTEDIYINGVRFVRKVYDSKDGLYINVFGTRLFYEDFN